MRLHLVALPHVKLGTDTTHLCAYSGKVMKAVKMWRERHEIILYAPEGPPIKGATLIPCLPDAQRQQTFGADDPQRLPNWPTDAQSLLFNRNVAEALRANWRPQELVLLTGGRTHLPIVESFPGPLYCEPFVGYEGIFTDKCAFESYAHMHTVYAKGGINDIRWFDCVIPPFCDPEEFPQLNDGKGKYLLFLGRLISRKGPHIAEQIARACKLPLVVAGAGGKLVCEKQASGSTSSGVITVQGGLKLVGLDVTIPADNVTYVGPVGIAERAKLMAGAKALLVPTLFCGPGENVAIEAMLAGTPVIAPDWGVFSETVMHGVSGFHFRMFQEGVDAVKKCEKLDPQTIRDYAIGRYSLDAVGPLYDKWFGRLTALYGEGWYAKS